MSGRLLFHTPNETLTVSFVIRNDIREAELFKPQFEIVCKRLSSIYPDGFTLKIGENEFSLDESFKLRASFSEDGKFIKSFLNYSGEDICEIPKLEYDWVLNIDVLSKGKYSQLSESDITDFNKEKDQSPTHTDMDSFTASFLAILTETGVSQMQVIENFIRKSYECFCSGNYYAPLSPLVQSSGFGKSKICDELLLTHPGITAVFRGPDPKKRKYSYPPEQSWVESMVKFIYTETVDELPSEESDFRKADASKYSIGCFLIAMRTLIVAYYKWYGDLRSEKDAEGNAIISREAAIRIIGEHFRSGSRDWGHRTKDKKELIKLVFEKQNISFGDLLRELKCLLKHSSHADSIISRLGISNNLVKELMPQTKTAFPFLFIFDEASVFDHYHALEHRLSGLHVLRRALHLLHLNTRAFFLIIGTNSDAIDFSPALNIESIRYSARSNLLPAFWLTRNSGIFANLLRLYEIEVSASFLLNRNVMKLFFTMGRPLWASVVIESALDLSVIKISNGSNSSMEALLSCLLCRADLNVVPSSILCRNLVKSHMAVVYYISTDSRTMKIGYPSEPPLALASRKIFVRKDNRESAFLALFEFFQRRAIDKGRISETIMEYFTLFAIDDVVNDKEYHGEFVKNNYYISEVSGFKNKNIDKVLSCETFILDIDWTNDEHPKNEPTESPMNTSEREEVDHENYHVINVKYFLKSLLTKSVYSEIEKYLPDYEPLMNGFVNASHFVNLERDSSGVLSKFAKTSPQEFKVDRSLLKMGLIRGCGFVLPPGTFGLDYIIPVLLNAEDPNRRPRYSFIGIQVKTVADYFSSEVAKTALPFVIEKCLNHKECANGNHHTGCMSDEEYEEIVSNQLTLILCADRGNVANRLKGLFYSAKPKFSSSLKRARSSKEEEQKEPMETTDHESEEEEDIAGKDVVEDIAERLSKEKLTSDIKQEEKELKERELLQKIEESKEIVEKLWPESMKSEIENSNYFNYPTFREMGEIKPDLLIRKAINATTSIQNLIWERGSGRSHRLTCIISNDLANFSHLATAKAIDICKRIVVYTTNIFDDVNDFHLPAVIDSVVSAEFSPLYQFNSDLRASRGKSKISNDEFASMDHYDDETLQKSINAAIARNNA